VRIAIFGAGAIGGLLAAKLAASGVTVTVVARGPHLAAMQANGIVLHSGGDTVSARVRAIADVSEAGEQDFVFVTTKAHAMVEAREALARLMGKSAALVTAVNGIPYWYFYGFDGPFRDRPVQSVDPGGALLHSLAPERAIGCVVYPAAEVTAPGEITHTYGDRFSLGEPSGSASPLLRALAEALIGAGFKAPIRPRIRDDIWVKLWGNLAFNPLSALSGALLDRLVSEPELRAVARAMMTEAQAAAEALGVRFAIPVDKRIDGAAEVGAHKTSMLQDLERGRPMETEALLGAPVELGALVGHTMPLCRAVLAMLRERGRTRVLPTGSLHAA
jgi:2-dehydropantoate 2-reductase